MSKRDEKKWNIFTSNGVTIFSTKIRMVQQPAAEEMPIE